MRGPRDAQLATVLPGFELTDSVIYAATRAATFPTYGVVASGITGMAGPARKSSRPPRAHEPGTATGLARSMTKPFVADMNPPFRAADVAETSRP